MISEYHQKRHGQGYEIKYFPDRGKGKISVAMTIEIVAKNRYFPGRLLKKGLLPRMTSTIIAAEKTDSINYPVLNYGVA